MESVYCFGIIPVRSKENGWEIFLVKHTKGHWGFPKGHSLSNESPEQIACREIFEETNLAVTKFFQLPPLLEKYVLQDGNRMIEKVVTYFLASVRGEVKLQEKEVCDSKWATLDEAHKLATHDAAKAICKEVQKLLSSLTISA